jgi:hypothetical protein
MNPAASSGLDATPEAFRPLQSPLVSSPGPCDSGQGAWRVSTTSVAFSRPLSARASLACLQACDMAFSGLPVSPGDVLWSARYPCLVSAESVPPGHQPGSRDGLLSGRGFPRDDSRFPPRNFHLAVLSAHSGRVTLVRGVTHGYAQVSILPLLSRAQQSFLTPYRGQDPDEHRWARVLSLLRRPVLSRAPAPCRACYGVSQP